MKTHLLSFLIVIIIVINVKAQDGVAINANGNPANPSAILDVSSLNKGVLIPRITQAQKNLIINPANGLMVYQTDQDTGFYYNAGTSLAPLWIQLMPNPAMNEFNMNSNKIVNLATCSDNLDAANKAYVDNAVSAGGGGGLTEVSSNQCTTPCTLTDCRAACLALGADWHVPTFEELRSVFSGALGTPQDGWINGNVWTTTPGWYGLVGSPGGAMQYGKFIYMNEASGGISYNSPASTFNCRCVK